MNQSKHSYRASSLLPPSLLPSFFFSPFLSVLLSSYPMPLSAFLSLLSSLVPLLLCIFLHHYPFSPSSLFIPLLFHLLLLFFLSFPFCSFPSFHFCLSSSVFPLYHTSLYFPLFSPHLNPYPHHHTLNPFSPLPVSPYYLLPPTFFSILKPLSMSTSPLVLHTAQRRGRMEGVS